MLRALISLCSLAAILCVSAAAYAQDCGCDHTVALDKTSVTGAELGLKPGDTVCIAAGERPFLRLKGFVGSAAQPITVKNCGGQVVIHNTDRAYALVVEDGSSYLHLTGTGDAAHPYGFKISAPDKEPYAAVGLWFNGKSTNYEADHIEIFNTGFAGVMSKTDPLCDGSADQDRFIQKAVDLHHLYIHDTGGEGMYVGSTQSAGHTITCEGQREVHQPHFLEGISIHDSIIEDTGWDGVQIGMARADCSFYRNTIHRVGLEGVQYQVQGLQLGTFSACDVYDNIITDGPAMGVFAQGAARTRVFNNIIARFGSDGIYANDNGHPSSMGQPYLFWHNTITGYARNGLTVFGGATRGSGSANNLVIGAAPGVSAGNDVSGWSAANDLVLATAQAAGVDPATFAPSASSPALGAGVLLAQVPRDMLGQLRPDPPAVGAREYVDPSAPPEDMGSADMNGADMGEQDQGAVDPMDLGADMPGDGLDDDPNSGSAMEWGGGLYDDIAPEPRVVEEDGCGCVTTRGAPVAPSLAWLVVGLGLLWRRRRG